MYYEWLDAKLSKCMLLCMFLGDGPSSRLEVIKRHYKQREACFCIDCIDLKVRYPKALSKCRIWLKRRAHFYVTLSLSFSLSRFLSHFLSLSLSLTLLLYSCFKLNGYLFDSTLMIMLVYLVLHFARPDKHCTSSHGIMRLSCCSASPTVATLEYQVGLRILQAGFSCKQDTCIKSD